MIGYIDRDRPRILQGGELVYHPQSERWGIVERVSACHKWSVLVKHSETESHAYAPSELLYIPEGWGPAYPCEVAR